ncbi:hypothetical protein EYF80_067960 [Liparis tanakae]|uniref:Uncharacterized protein n=1 Tax=Liparis tanakae TaxID=230148 RepID=A0A4Z2DZN6_9TELE|nr:hypothetical protein EYF80_067960 [Liparis tanakae]
MTLGHRAPITSPGRRVTQPGPAKTSYSWTGKARMWIQPPHGLDLDSGCLISSGCQVSGLDGVRSGLANQLLLRADWPGD